jgi:hypothetical protein
MLNRTISCVAIVLWIPTALNLNALGDDWARWCTESQNGQVKRVYALGGQIGTGLEVKEQDGFGVIDMRMHYPGRPTDWICGNSEQRVKLKSFYRGPDEVLVGLQVGEQAGFGVVDIRFAYARRSDVARGLMNPVSWSPWIVGNSRERRVNQCFVL